MSEYKFKKHYKESTYREYLYDGFLGYLFRHQHRLLTPDSLLDKEKILEIGPGFEPHIKFKKLNFKEYHCIELNNSMALKEYFKTEFPEVFFKEYDGKKISYPDNTFDRIVISHTLEHIPNAENFINEMLRVLKPGSFISIALPCDNGFLWRAGRYLLKKTYLKFKGVNETDYNYLMANEHINTIFQLLSILKKKFSITKEIYIPFRLKIVDFNLIYVCQVRKN